MTDTRRTIDDVFAARNDAVSVEVADRLILLQSGTVKLVSSAVLSLAVAGAVVEDTIVNGVVDKAPSQNAVFDALALKAPLASPALTGNPTAPTQTAGNNSTRIATTAFVTDAVSTAIAGLSGVYQPVDTDLTALAALSTTGMLARTGSGTYALRTITGPAAGITVSNGNGVSGNPTLALANDLAGLEGLSTTGLARRTGTSTWDTITPTNIIDTGIVPTFADFEAAGVAAWLLNKGLVITSDGGRDAGATDSQDILLLRRADFTGGSFGFVNANLRVLSVVSAGVDSFEWATVSVLDSSAEAGDGEHTSHYVQTIKRSTGGAWGLVTDFIDHDTDPVGSSVSCEIGSQLSGGDANAARVLADLWAKRRSGAAGTAVAAWGLRINADSNATITNALRFNLNGGTITNLISSDNYTVTYAGQSISAGWYSSDRLSAGGDLDHGFILSIDGTAYWQTYATDAAVWALRDINNTVDRLTVSTAGLVTVPGTLTSTGLLTATAGFTAGAASSVNVNGSTAAHSFADDFVVRNETSNAGITIIASNASSSNVFFGDPDSVTIGRVAYSHATDTLNLGAGGTSSILALTTSGATSVVPLTISNTAAALVLEETDAGTDEKQWSIRMQSGDLQIRKRTDTGSLGATAISIQSTGTTVDEIEFNATTIDLNANLDVSGTGAFGGTVTFTDANFSLSIVADDPIITFASGDAIIYDRAGNTLALWFGSASEIVFSAGGSQFGAATGGMKGVGTINAKGVYDDDNLLTDLVLDLAESGDWDHKAYAKHPLNTELASWWLDPKAYVKFWREARHLPGMKSWKDEAGRPSIGEVTTRLTGVVETLAVHLANHEDRITELEERFAA